jgi:hypothetical protein
MRSSWTVNRPPRRPTAAQMVAVMPQGTYTLGRDRPTVRRELRRDPYL